MKCDKDTCTKDAVSFGQGFERGKESSVRCRDHPWSSVEMRQMIEAHSRSRVAWGLLTEAERSFVLEAEGEQRNQVLQALVEGKRGQAWE